MYTQIQTSWTLAPDFPTIAKCQWFSKALLPLNWMATIGFNCFLWFWGHKNIGFVGFQRLPTIGLTMLHIIIEV